ncbi:hypothetical protein MMC29_008316, partial [Sticta canariensis]|nr:hypothetical protein [Sticta canariensis]
MLQKARNGDNHAHSIAALQSSGISERRSRLPHPSKPPSRTSPLKFFASSATVKSDPPVDPQKIWTAEFLNDLRSNRPARPNGSRPQPNRDAVPTPLLDHDLPLRTSSAMSGSIRQTEPLGLTVPDRCASAMSHRRGPSTMPTAESVINNRGRTLAQKPTLEGAARDFSTATGTFTVPPGVTYKESGQRWMEKQEARSLREALEDMDLREEESLHAAAQDEASELVWKHQNPNGPERNPYAPYSYRSHLRKGSYARSRSSGQYTDSAASNEANAPGKQSVSDQSTSEKSSGSRRSSGSSMKSGKTRKATARGSDAGVDALWDSPRKKADMTMTFPIPPVNASRRRCSSGSRPGKVGGGLFRNPNDQIYEEPEELTVETETRDVDAFPPPLQVKAWNPISKLPTANQSSLVRSSTSPLVEGDRKLSRYDIHKNPPSQSRNPSYLRNTLPPPTPPDYSVETGGNEGRSGTPSQKNGIDIRSDDIRAATSMRMRERSPKLPSPTVVSDRPGRPIVSFDRNWKPREVDPKSENPVPSRPSSRGGVADVVRQPAPPTLPQSRASAPAPAIPALGVPDPPAIQINEEAVLPSVEIPSLDAAARSSSIPSISVEETPSATRPLPTPTKNSRLSRSDRPLPNHSATAPVSTSSSAHWSPFPGVHRATAQCAACALPIAGRIVSASSQRFHPHCFTCFHCAALLEHVAFYPEPSASRESRLARIDARSRGVDLPEEEGRSGDDDGDAGLRFFCHLDFHEQFSPRCRGCKTPIEGEVVVACGGEWHVGHFFCAECGDPFDAKTPFVEREGHAWCVGCHARRFSGKCKGCRKPIVDLVVKALGGEWHERCFCCK